MALLCRWAGFAMALEPTQLSVLSLLAAAAVAHGGSAMTPLKNQRPPLEAQ